MRWVVGVLAVVGGLAALPASSIAASCSDHPNQAAAQRAADTRDADGDGVYCESLPCPCSTSGQGDVRPEPAPTRRACARPAAVQPIRFSAARYPGIRRHVRRALRRGWPTTLVVNRPNADDRRDRLLESIPARRGFDRDEYPPAAGRGRGEGLERGTSPRGWRASVMYVRSSENRSHGAALGGALRRFCNGTRFRYVFF